MKNKVLVSIVCSLLLVSQFSLAQNEILPQEITSTTCGLEDPCPEELECFDFPEIGLRCAEPDPCSYYECPKETKCVIAESYPPQIICSYSAENGNDTVEESINLDENIEPEDLEVGNPKILPGHLFYFFKDWARSIRSLFAFGTVNQAKLRSKFANERLMELKKLIEESDDSERIKRAIEAYQKEIEEIKNKAEEIKEKAEDNPKVEEFLDKFLNQQTLHQKLLSKLEEQVPEQAFEEIKQARERHLEKFQEVMLRLEDRMKEITEKLDETLENQTGSKYKNFKNLEILLELEEKVPEEAKEAIRKVQENALNRLKGNLEQMSPEDQEKFKEYIEEISGSAEIHLEITESIRLELKERLEIQERIMGTEDQIREQIMDRVRERAREMTCPEIEKPASGFCKEGRIVVEEDEKGCVVDFSCIIPEEIVTPIEPTEPEGCFALWDPVCGADGKTYSNECFAELAGVEVNYKGRCKEEVSCEEKCKSLGYLGGICRTWTVTPTAQMGCALLEFSIGETSDCFVEPLILGIGRACCCQK